MEYWSNGKNNTGIDQVLKLNCSWNHESGLVKFLACAKNYIPLLSERRIARIGPN